MSASLKVTAVDVYGRPIRIRRVIVRHRDTRSLFAGRAGMVDVTVMAHGYRTGRRFVNVQGDTEAWVPLVVSPRKVIPVFPSWRVIEQRLPQTTALLDRSEILWGSITPLHKATLLNVATKAAVSPIGSWPDILSGLKLIRIAQDRLFVETTEEAHDRVASRWDHFERASGSLHSAPAGYALHASYKTSDPVGNLQVTFFRPRTPLAVALGWVADVDIDNAGGLAHAFDVVRHHLTGTMTHPFDIHDILVRWQGLDPCYTLRPK